MSDLIKLPTACVVTVPEENTHGDLTILRRVGDVFTYTSSNQCHKTNRWVEKFREVITADSDLEEYETCIRVMVNCSEGGKYFKGDKYLTNQ